MADKKQTLEDAAAITESAIIPEQDITLLQTDAVILVVALERLNAEHLADSLKHQQEIDNPSWLNPQVEQHTAKRDELVVAIDYNTQLIRKIAEPFGIETGPELKVVIETADGVRGPAEENRPPSANPGSTSSRSI
jgi:hypothetical protein